MDAVFLNQLRESWTYTPLALDTMYMFPISRDLFFYDGTLAVNIREFNI